MNSALSKKILNINSWYDYVLFANSLTRSEKGYAFEYLTKIILLTYPKYKSIVRNVWLVQEDIPEDIRAKLNLPSTDEGIDIIVETHTNEYWAIQCKYKSKSMTPTYKELSTFISLTNVNCTNISLALLIHSGDKGVKKRKLLGENYSEVGLEFWLSLKTDDWERIHAYIRGSAISYTPLSPRPHQKNAVTDAHNHFVKNERKRGRLIMPCGTGKSLTAFWIAKAINSSSIVVAVPSLALIKQSLEDWTREFIANNEYPRPNLLVICSDESTAKVKNDEFVSDVHSLGIPTTTNVDKISNFLSLKTPGKKIVFTTYQSSNKLASAAQMCNFSFDVAIFDEAHKTVGIRSKAFATLLSDNNISIKQRLFMTATEKVLRGKNDDIFSMDDKKVYGELFHQLSFKDAIHSVPPIICDYKILTITVTNDEIRQVIIKNRLLTVEDGNIEEKEAQAIAAAISLRKAALKYGINHIVSFHRSIKSADEFAQLHESLNLNGDDGIQLMPSHVSSKKSAGVRAKLLDDFSRQQQAIMTNARCLSEGVDVPAIDCVLFADPKESIIDIVQSAGRALRPYQGKKFGYIMLPLVVPDNMSLDEFAETTPFKAIARMVAALSTQDERIAEEFRLIHEDHGSVRRYGNKLVFEGSVPSFINLDLDTFAQSINAKVWERVARVNWRLFSDAREFVHKLGFKNSFQWYDYCKTDKKPKDIPTTPWKIYKDLGWKNWGDWLGTNYVHWSEKRFLSYEEAKTFVQTLELNNRHEWLKYLDSGQKPDNIPAYPWDTYKNKGWKGMGDFFGTGNSLVGNFLPFDEARTFVRKLKLNNHHEWRTFTKSLDKPSFIPASPERFYKDKGWKGFGDWLGNGNEWTAAAGYQKYISYEQSKDIIHPLSLTNKEEWESFFESGKMPFRIPPKPNIYYKGKGWISWDDWLGIGDFGTRRIPLHKYIPYEEAKSYVQTLNLKGEIDWNTFVSQGDMTFNVAPNPNVFYRDKGWISWSDWLGIEGAPSILERDKKYISFEDAHAFVLALKLKSIKDWRDYVDSKEFPYNIPSDPDKYYYGFGWVSWSNWLGLKIRIFIEAREYVHSLNLKNRKEWEEFCHSDKKPSDIPRAPHLSYKNKGWIGTKDWLGTQANKPMLPETVISQDFLRDRAFVHSLQLQNQSEWKKYLGSDDVNNKIAKKPDKLYKGMGWAGWHDWLGVNFLPFVDARKFVHALKIKTNREWKQYSKSDKRPSYIPSAPHIVYLNKGWNGIGDWIGTKRPYYGKIEHRSFNEARAYVHKLQLKNHHEWRAYCKSGKKPYDIPTSPESKYKDSGWAGFGDWLGTGNEWTAAPGYSKYISYDLAKKIVNPLKLKSRMEWVEYVNSGKKPKNIPAKPESYYYKKGWLGYSDWLGTEVID